MRRIPLLLAIVLALGLVSIGATAASAGATGGTSVDLGHQVLPANDGWASSGPAPPAGASPMPPMSSPSTAATS